MVCQPKHPKKGKKNNEQNGRTHICTRKEMDLQEDESQGEHQVFELLPVTKSISNNEKRRPHEQTPSLNEPMIHLIDFNL